MWAEAWVQSVVARNFVALAVTGDMALRMSAEWFEFSVSVVFASAELFAATLLWSCLAYVVHAQILSPRDLKFTTTIARVIGFALRSFGIVIVIGAVVALVTFILAKLFVTGSPVVVEFYFMLAAIVLGFPLFIWLATLLPAYVAGRAGGVNAAVERGKSHFGWIAGRLLVGPCLVFVLSVALYLLLPFPNDSIGPFWNEQKVLLPLNVLGSLLFNIVLAFVTALTAVILSRAFLREEGMPDAAVA